VCRGGGVKRGRRVRLSLTFSWKDRRKPHKRNGENGHSPGQSSHCDARSAVEFNSRVQHPVARVSIGFINVTIIIIKEKKIVAYGGNITVEVTDNVCLLNYVTQHKLWVVC
jgi:hypothetical protein